MSPLKHLLGKFRAARMLARIMKDFHNWRDVWQAYRGRGPVPPFRFRSGLQIEHASCDDIIPLYIEIFIRQDYTHSGFYTPKDGDVILDIGANIGCFSLSQLQLGKKIHIHAFEPSAATRERLTRNLNINNFVQQVTIHPYGLSDRNSHLILDGHQLAGSRSAHTSGETDTGEPIECVSLSDAMKMCNYPKVALLKMDIEGSEIDVFQEQDDRTWNNIERVALEFHGSIRPGAREQLTTRFQERGYRIVNIYAPTPDGQDGILQAERIR